MKYLLYSTITLSFILLAYSCNGGKGNSSISDSDNKAVSQSKFAQQYPDFNTQTFSEIFKTKVQGDSLLNNLYAKSDYKPLWINDTLNTSRIAEFVAILSKVEEHGLPLGFFGKDKIESLTDSIDNKKYGDSINGVYHKIVELELLSTQTALKYINGMSFGFLDPKVLYKKEYNIEIQKPDSAFYAKMHEGVNADPIVAIQNSHPTDRIYVKMQEEYKTLQGWKDMELSKIANKGATVSYKVGDKNPNISLIAKRLIATGEYMPDALSTDSLHQTLNENLLAAVNQFRKRMSYPEDAEVGGITIDALNRSTDYYQQKVQANMERYRWRRAKNTNEKNIDVNVAAFNLIATQPDSLPLVIRVCVGGVGNKTPLLESDISYMNLNPQWNVPVSIARGEISIKQKKDPSYLRRNNMKLYQGGKEVDASSINWDQVNPDKFNYSIRQGSGNGNSLGRIKFMFNNPFSVYLHDTPMKSAFLRKNRAVSHGCVRVQKPVDLAFFCLGAVTDEYKDQLLISIDQAPISDSGKQMQKDGKLKKLPDIINPKDKISLFIDYRTIYMIADDDTLYYADDVYSYDDLIIKGLSL